MWVCKYLFETLLSIILGRYPELELLDCKELIIIFNPFRMFFKNVLLGSPRAFLFACLFCFRSHLDKISEKAMAPHSSTLAWRIPWMEEPGRLQSMGSGRVGRD